MTASRRYSEDELSQQWAFLDALVERQAASLRAGVQDVEEEFPDVVTLADDSLVREVEMLRAQVVELDALRPRVREVEVLRAQVTELESLREHLRELDGLRSQMRELETLRTRVSEVETLRARVRALEGERRQLLQRLREAEAAPQEAAPQEVSARPGWLRTWWQRLNR